MNMIRVTAKTLDEAITKALIELGTTSDNLDYNIIEKGSSGLFGIIGAKSVVIEAKRKKTEEEMLEELTSDKKPKKIEPKKVEPKKAEPAAKPIAKPVVKAEAKPESKPEVKPDIKPAAPRKSVDGAIYETSAKNFLTQMFAAMNMDVEIQTVFHESDKELEVNMIGADMGILIGKRGQTLDSLQYLVSLVVNKDCEGYVRVKLDTENYRERRKETLEILAKNIAYKVKRTRRSVSLEPMNPYERRIIHASLQNDKYVVTRSEGEDPFRHVVISLKRDKDYRENKERRANTGK